jgi:3-oxoacyl-(acyl-carrier-protein) synthase
LFSDIWSRMNIRISGVGLWARGLTSFDEFLTAYEDGFAGITDAEFVAPKPATIPARERRRAGLLINLAVEVAHQACEHAGVDKHLVPSVFTSAMGDTMITDYMCRKLCSAEKLLSPTKFHNSVHNAPSGYWTISAGNRAPSTFVGGAGQSFGAGLFEAASLAQAHSGPVLLVGYDIANEPPFRDITPIAETLGVALILEPAGDSVEGKLEGKL